MDPLLATLILILLALLGARISFSTQNIPQGPRLLFRTGMHWLVLGVLLGPEVLGLMTVDAVEDLYPLLAVGLGWVGLLFGMQLDRRNLRQFPVGYYLIAFLQAVVTFLVFVGVGWMALDVAGLRSPESTTLLLGAAATASVTTPAGIAMISANFLVRGNVRQLLFFIASVDAIVGLTALQVTYATFHPATIVFDLGVLPSPLWVAIALALGLLCAVIFLWLVRTRPEAEELVLFLLGIAALASGAALQLQLSPLFVCATMGAVIANLSRESQRVFTALQKWEKPIYVILLLLAGALLRFPTWWVVPLGVAYGMIRAVGKLTGGALLASTVPLSFRPPRRLGLGLLPQGGISLAMAASLVLTYSGLTLAGGALNGVDVLFAIVVTGIALSELVGPFFAANVLRRAGEISPRVEEALSRGDEERARAEALRHTSPGEGMHEGPPR